MNTSINRQVKDLMIDLLKNEKKQLLPLDLYQLSGIFSSMVAQYELRIFNWFIAENNLWVDEETKVDSTDKIVKLEGFKLYNQETKQTFDVANFLQILGKTDKLSKSDAMQKLIENRGNTFINRIINWAKENNKNDLTWFQDVRNYRNEIIHNVDSTSGYPFTQDTQSVFKTSKTLFNANLLIDFAISFSFENFDGSYKELELNTGTGVISFFNENNLLKHIYKHLPLFISTMKLVDKNNKPLVSISSLLETPEGL